MYDFIFNSQIFHCGHFGSAKLWRTQKAKRKPIRRLSQNSLSAGISVNRFLRNRRTGGRHWHRGMLRCAVGRSQAGGNVSQSKRIQLDKSTKPKVRTDNFSYVICDARSGGLYVKHVSEEFQELFECEASEYLGKKASELLKNALSTSTLKKVLAARGLTDEEAHDAIERMSRAARQNPANLASGELTPSFLVANVRNSGKLFACEMSWCQNRHPVLGWAYWVGLQREISAEDFSAEALLEAARDDLSYQQMCRNWAESQASCRGTLSQKMESLSEKFHAVAEQVWKDELSKGLKPKGPKKTAETDTSSIWSRSTASTLASTKDSEDSRNSKDPKNPKTERNRGPHHFGALFMCGEAQEPHDAQECRSALQGTLVEQRDAKTLNRNLESDFESLDSEFSDEWQDCAPGPKPDLDSSPLDAESADLSDPVQHLKSVAKGGLDSSKLPFVIAAPTVEGCPIAFRSAGFEQLAMEEYFAQGSDLRQVLQPSNDRALHEWKVFVGKMGRKNFEREVLKEGDFEEGIALLGDCELQLPAGELAFVHCFSCSPCLVYAKQVELDDCPFLLALCLGVPNEVNCACTKAEFDKLSKQMDDVVSALASHFFYSAPMRRQGFVD
eukprot:Skav206247  [mRNA]  locus=scaffold1425:199884:201725:- [translate_table: standard]